jgi:hypothetical protein
LHNQRKQIKLRRFRKSRAALSAGAKRAWLRFDG